MRSISVCPLVVAIFTATADDVFGFQNGNQTAIQQATQADVICIGKVADFEPELQTIELTAGEKVACLVASIRIEESLVGADGVTTIRVAQVSRQRGANSPEVIRRVRPGKLYGRPQTSLILGQQACFFLQKVPTADCFVPVNLDLPLDKSDPNYANSLGGIRKIAKVIEKPMDCLKSKNTFDRQLAASVLVLRYRAEPTIGSGNLVNEPLSAQESKLILAALAEMQWGELPFDQNGVLSLQNAFSQLQVTEKDGWKLPEMKDDDDCNLAMGEAVAKWMKGHSAKYQIQRISAGPAKPR
jgi:hypothetical protein